MLILSAVAFEIRRRTDTELLFEAAGEIERVVVAHGIGGVVDRVLAVGEHFSGFLQTHHADIFVWREASHTFHLTEEYCAANSKFASQLIEREVRVGETF